MSQPSQIFWDRRQPVHRPVAGGKNPLIGRPPGSCQWLYGVRSWPGSHLFPASQNSQLVSLLAGKRLIDKPVLMVAPAQRGNLTSAGLKITVPTDVAGVVPQYGLGGFHGEFTFIALAQLPHTTLPGQG